ncbi:hypothetical protein AC622_07275 [Bacillus sp. FJAT-27916]|uniref:hypothetical protein n=1 Tax=Bacillaceae TaxID=186817 RepID=UPI00067134F2|nr:hypothetical protein [Bacillus sp. FJAT-27916]KMY44075.1 hypothetical protein AC622_07275 [Bacillus sp. FJAT-27916]
MTHKVMSSFASGILLASCILGGVYFFSSDDAGAEETSGKKETAKATETETVTETPVLSAEDMKTQLETEGYVVLTDEEYLNEIETAEEKAKAEAEKAAAENSEKVVYKTVINVASGMTTSDVAEVLVAGNIIKDASSFVKAVESKGVANKLRLGVFKVDSKMSVDKIISMIFKS